MAPRRTGFQPVPKQQVENLSYGEAQRDYRELSQGKSASDVLRIDRASHCWVIGTVDDGAAIGEQGEFEFFDL
jgi:hypothetical protein